MFSRVSPFYSLSLTLLHSFAMVAAIVAIMKDGFWDDPAALNSNLLPV